MSSLRWTLIGTVLFVLISGVKPDTTAYPVIPDHLLQCYTDDGIYHRANRMSASFEYFVDLIKKIENSPTSRNLNARELSLLLLHYVKQDGIQSLKAHTKFLHGNILPFAPSGDEYFKHRLTLVGLVPKIDRNYMTALNESLTQKELCNLHFMLSYSIDPYKRDDEKCYTSYDSPQPTYFERSPSHIGRGYYSRHRRNIHLPENLNSLTRENEPKNKLGKLSKNKDVAEFYKIVKERTSQSLPSDISPKDGVSDYDKDLKEVQQILNRIRRSSSKNEKDDIEIISPLHQSSPSEKDKFTIGEQELLSDGEGSNRKGMQSLVQMRSFGRNGGRPSSNIGYGMDETAYSGIIPGIPLSDCPVINGVIETPYGALTIGSVIAGIAAGLNPEEIPPIKLSVQPSELESITDRVKNTWAATLAGTVADSISSSFLLETDNLQVLRGGWNETGNPKWYLLKTNQFRQPTEVSIRGSLDGLIMALNAKEWVNKFSNLKLSNMLQIYYYYTWGTVGARYRVQLRNRFAPEEMFRKQVHLMSSVLKKQKTNVFTVLEYSNLAREAVNVIVRHIQTMDDYEKSSIGVFETTVLQIPLDIIAVVDSTWSYEHLFKILEKLKTDEMKSWGEGNMTILCGIDGKVLTVAQHITDLHKGFTKEMLYENCTRGMKYPAVFDSLDFMYRGIYHQEKQANKINTTALVTILFPYEQILNENLEFAVERSRIFRRDFPDVRLMVAPHGRTESFGSIVKSSQDLFPIARHLEDPGLKSVDELIRGVKNSFHRLTRPSCGSYFDDESQGSENRVTSDISPGAIAFFRLIPQYFYTVKGQALITIRSKQRVPIVVCHSRETERPIGPTPRNQPPIPDFNNNRNGGYEPDYRYEMPYGRQTEENGPVTCETISTGPYVIELNNPCEGAGSLDGCRPLYFSLSSPLQETVTTICPTCRLLTNVQFEISAVGLTCYNSAVATLISPFLLSCLLLFVVFEAKIF